LSMRDEDPAKRRGGVKLAPAFLSRPELQRETLNQNPVFETASNGKGV